MARKIVENTNLRSVNTMTAEEIEKLIAEQQSEMKEEEKMVQDETKTQCVCGVTCQEMDLTYCDICGEVICDVCGDIKEDSYKCGECVMEQSNFKEETVETQSAEKTMLQDKVEERKQTNEEAFMEKLEAAMKKAWSQKADVVKAGVVEIKSQSPQGKSLWAQWVKFGYLKSENVYWAFRTLKSGSRQWLAVYIDSGRGKGKFFDLTSDEGKSELLKMEELYRQHLISKGNPWCTKAYLKAQGHWESWDLNKIYENLYR